MGNKELILRYQSMSAGVSTGRLVSHDVPRTHVALNVNDVFAVKFSPKIHFFCEFVLVWL